MSLEGKVIAVSISSQKQTQKKNVKKGILKENYGLVGDAHADAATHRQISLLAIESINKMREVGLDVNPGDFADNITVKGLDLTNLPLKTYLSLNDAVLEVTQIGKECHNRCAIYEEAGDCIMPREGIFAKVVKGGLVRMGNKITVL
ncbi:MAG: MOSC domain-containing protein [Methanobacteriaceae archaeon]|nr:MOSC domain-containing protein [Methanobacteriaceae archaeon]